MKNIVLVFLVLVMFLFLNGCANESTGLNNNKTASYNSTTYANQTIQNKTNEIPSGCAYQNPPCDNKHICQNNSCVLKVGCQYANSLCGADKECINNSCSLKKGCAYNNPPCDDKHSCTYNSCILKTGCQYSNPSCDQNDDCINDQCVLKQGCQYNNPSCNENYSCISNNCVLKSGCSYGNPSCSDNQNCVGNQCILKTGCQYNNPSCDENYSCISNNCVLKSGCSYGNPFCSDNQNCVGNQCILKSGCQYNNPSCNENSSCKYNMCIPKYICLNEECNGQNINYIIITRPIFIDSLKNFISFKNNRGFKIGVLTAEYINSSSSKVLLADKIKDTIQYFRKQGTKFFLLVGDAYTSIDYGSRTIPPTYHLEMNSLKDNWSLPTGYFYMDLQTVQYQMEGFNDVFFADPNNWDPTNSGINHAIYSASSNWQDFAYVGRWPVRTPEEVTVIAQKTISAENNIENNQYENHILILTVPQEPPYPVDCKKTYTSDSAGFFAKNTCENSITDLTNSLGNNAQLYTIDQTGTQNREFEQVLFGSNNLAVQLSFHGNHNMISVGGKIYGNADSSRFQNVFPLMVPTGCSVGSFYWGADDSLDEAFLKAKNGPAVLAQPTYLLTFYDKLMEGKSVGEAYYAAETIDQSIIDAWKQNQTSWFGSGNGLTLNGDDGLIGDPSLVIYPK